MERGEPPAAEGDRIEDLVARSLRGDADAFRVIVETHEAAVFGLCRRLLYGREAEAEEASQDTFINAYRYLSSLENRARFAPWLYQIARSMCRDRRRRWRAEERALEAFGELKRRSADDGQGDSEVLGIRAALDDLLPEERRALELRYFEGLAYQEIAEILGKSFSRVDHLIRKARSRLARRLEVRKDLENRQLLRS